MELVNLNLMDFIQKYLLILIVATYVLGSILKGLDMVKDKYITLMLGIFCITTSIALTFINNQSKIILDNIISGILQGIISWGIAIGINQTVKQLNKKE